MKRRHYAAVLKGDNPSAISELYYFDSESMRKAWLKDNLPETYDKQPKEKVKILSKTLNSVCKYHKAYKITFEAVHINSVPIKWVWCYNSIPEYLIYQ